MEKRAIEEYKIKDEADFVEKFCTSRRPCVFWLPDNFDMKKVDELTSERGFVIMKGIPNGETICL